MKKHLIFQDEKSDKFWSIETVDSKLTVTYGKTGSSGVTAIKQFDSENKCLQEAEKLVTEKLKKGYVELSEAQPSGNSLPKKVALASEKPPVNMPTKSNATDTASDQISLYYQEGGSDKVYQALIQKEGNGYLVNFAFGRRGATLQTGTKTSTPVTYQAAQKILNQLINSKKAKGYTEGESGTPYTQTSKEERISGVNCQLLNPIEDDELQHYLENENYAAQEKLDGNRMLIRKKDNVVEGINRKGLLIALPLPLHQQVLTLAGDFILDGESIGDIFYPFDLLLNNTEDIQHTPYHYRHSQLTQLLSQKHASFIKPVALLKTTAEKRALVDTLRKENKEGIVFKDLHAAYKAGRPSSGGTQVKYKFYASATRVKKYQGKSMKANHFRLFIHW